MSEGLFVCDKCDNIEHRNAIDNLCDYIITSCINASINCSTTSRSSATNVTGWIDHIKPERTDHLCGTGYGLNQVNQIMVLFTKS